MDAPKNKLRPVPFKVFISYSTKDLEKANSVKSRLGNFAAFGVETYLAEYDSQPGTNLTEDLRKNLRDADVFCLLWSHNAKDSDWVSQEIGIATATNKLVIPVVLDRDLPPSGFIKDRKFISAYESFETAMDSLQKIITLHAATKAMKSKEANTLALLGLGALVVLVLLADN